MGRIRTSIELFKASWAVISQDKELLALPVLSGIASLITIAIFAVPIIATTNFDNAESDLSGLSFILSFVVYLVLAFITIFFNSALVHASNERMSGGDPNISSALAGAAGRIHRILPWALVSATVSQLIRAIQERMGILSSIISIFGAMAWAAVTFLVLPILVLEDVGPIDAIKRSSALLRQAWGEGLSGRIGMGLIGFVAAIPLFILAALGVASGSAAVAIPLVGIAVIGLLVVTIVLSALSVVYQTALYRFATNQTVPVFGAESMRGAFSRR